MTPKQKSQLFDFLVRVAILVVPLVGFLIYQTAHFKTTYIIYFVVGLFCVISYLIYLQTQFSSHKSSVELQSQDYIERINLTHSEIDHEQKAIKSYLQKIINYSQLKEMMERLSSCLSTDETTKALCEEVFRLFGGKDTTIILYLFQPSSIEIGISFAQKGVERIQLKSKKGDTFDGWVMKNMQPLLIEDIKADYRFDADNCVSEDHRSIRSLISVPLVIGNKPLGIVRIDNPNENYFHSEDLRLLTTVGDIGSVAIENAQLYGRVEQLAIRDSLTNLYLRRYLMDRLEEEIMRHLRSKTPCSFMMIDLDDFKKYNDQFGHTAGDIVLRTVGILLEDFFKAPGNVICRYGGEEFAVLLPDCPKNKASNLAEAFRKKVEEQIIFLRREKTRITVSVGVATFPKDAQSKEELIDKADQALYKAKAAGRNCVCVS